MKTGYDQFFKEARKNSAKNSTSNQANGNKSSSRGFNKSGVRLRGKSVFPVKSFIGFAAILASGYLILDHGDVIEKQFKRVELSLPVAFAAEEKSSQPVDSKADNKSETKAENKPDNKSDDADYLFKLSERKKQLDRREEELNRYAEEIAKQKTEIEEKLKKLEDTRTKISLTLEDRKKADDGKVDTLVQMYSNMKPQQAAKVFENLDEDLVIEILSRMKKKSAADILNLVKPEKAQVLAEKYTGYRVPASK